MLSPRQDFYFAYSKAQGTLQRRRPKECKSQKVGRRAWYVTLWAWVSRCKHSLPAAAVACRELGLLWATEALTRPYFTLLTYHLLRNSGPSILPKNVLFWLMYRLPLPLICTHGWAYQRQWMVQNPWSHSPSVGHKRKDKKIWVWDLKGGRRLTGWKGDLRGWVCVSEYHIHIYEVAKSKFIKNKFKETSYIAFKFSFFFF